MKVIGLFLVSVNGVELNILKEARYLAKNSSPSSKAATCDVLNCTKYMLRRSFIVLV